MQPPALSELGRYQLVELLGRGGMAEVYKAKLAGALGVNRLVAVKRMLPEARRNQEYVELFIREARVCSRMMHPNLIQIFELGQTDAELFLAMELVEGPDLRKVLTAHQRLGRTFPIEFAICVANGVLRGLDAAHRLTDDAGQPLGVVHRDLSPANVLLSYEGAIKVADFGVAHSSENQAIPSDASKIKGKLQYMAPEQIVGGPLDARVDVFAAAAVLYEMLSGKELYPWTDPGDVVQRVAHAKHVPIAEVVQGLDAQLAGVIAKGLAPDPAQRYPSCDAFATDLARLSQQGHFPCATEPELALYLQVLTPRQPFRAELVYTPSAPAPSGSSPAMKAVVASDPRAATTPGLARGPTSALRPISPTAGARAAVAPPQGAFAPGSRPPSRGAKAEPASPPGPRPASGGHPPRPNTPALIRPAPAPMDEAKPIIKGFIATPAPLAPAGSSPRMRAQVVAPQLSPPPSPPAPPTASLPPRPPAPPAEPARPPSPPEAPAVLPPRPITGGDLARPDTPRPDSGAQLDALLVSYLAGDAVPPVPAEPPDPTKKGKR